MFPVETNRCRFEWFPVTIEQTLARNTGWWPVVMRPGCSATISVVQPLTHGMMTGGDETRLFGNDLRGTAAASVGRQDDDYGQVDALSLVDEYRPRAVLGPDGTRVGQRASHRPNQVAILIGVVSRVSARGTLVVVQTGNWGKHEQK
jgi:hypothetical protein